MGQCGTGGRNRPLPAELQEATRKYFGLGELPVTLLAESRRHALIIKVAGLDHDNLLLALEAGFHARRYWIKEAAIHISRGLFLATFELMPRTKSDEGENAATVEHAEHAMAASASEVRVVQLQSPHGRLSSRRSVTSGQGIVDDLAVMRTETKPDLVDGSVTAPPASGGTEEMGKPKSLLVASGSQSLEGTVSNARQLARADDRAARHGASVRLTILREWAPGLRIALKETIQASGLRIVSARLSVSQSASKRTVKDTFWLAAVSTETEAAHADPGAKSLPTGPSRAPSMGVALHLPDAPAWLSDLGVSLTKAQPAQPLVGETADACAPADGQEFEKFVTHQGSGGSQGDSILPAALQSKAADLNYHIRLDPEWGLQFDGKDKYTGSGMGVAHRGWHVLQFSTFYIQRPAEDGGKAAPRAAGWGASFAALIGMQRRQAVAEFITEYHPGSRCLTIFKVFLNDVLPAGKRAGARATAEQLPCMRVPGNDRWDGPAALRELQQVHLCDCVNWNTYCLMSKVGKAPDDGVERWLLEEEAKASGLTLDEIRSKSVVEIFSKTALGRLVYGVLKIWKEEHSVEHKVESVSVEWNSHEQELICGEYRAVMDIHVKLQEARAADSAQQHAGSGL